MTSATKVCRGLDTLERADMDDNQLGALVEQAKSGDATALEEVVRAIQDEIFDFALRMLGDPTDAQDASQEVLVR
jgi:hypothetical protein